MRYFLQYWKVDQADINRASALNHAASAQYGRISPGDLLWIVTIRDYQLKLLGRLRVEKIVGQKEAELLLGPEIYEAEFHALAVPNTVELVSEINIQDLAKVLRFKSERDKLALNDAGAVDGKQIQTLRELTPESAQLLAERWGHRSAKHSGPRFWWVSQNQTWQQESSGGYLWAPLINKSGHVPFHWETMRDIQPKDLIFHHVRGEILAVSQARSVAYRSPRPSEFANSNDAWALNGLKVDCSYTHFRNAIKVSDYMEQIRPLLPQKYSPLTKSEKGAQLYLVSIPDSLGRLLLKLSAIPAPPDPEGTPSSEIGTSGLGRGGAGFGGSPEENREVETAAISHVTREYEQNSWNVESVEQDKCGYDLLCTKCSIEEHVEVKGIRGQDPSFIITVGEVRSASHDVNHVFCIVTEALDKPHTLRLTGKEFLKRYELEPLSFRATTRAMGNKQADNSSGK
jgi:Domain of unknown function (DUF3883)